MATETPTILFDPAPRSAATIFAGDMQQRLERLGRGVGLDESRLGKLSNELVEQTLPDAVAIVGQTDLDARRLARAAKLRVVINVEGNFAQNVDYAECFRRGVRCSRFRRCSRSRWRRWRSAWPWTWRAASRAPTA